MHNAFEFNEIDIQQEEAQPSAIDIEEEEKEKIIQKEAIQTGSVSFFSLSLSSKIINYN